MTTRVQSSLLVVSLALLCPAGYSADPVIGNGTGLLAGYFPGNSFTGTPTIRLDPNINFSWSTVPIDGFPADHFSVRWQGNITPKTTEPTTLILSGDDGVRLWIDGNLVIDDWTNHGTKEYRFTLPVGISPHDLRLDYFENTGGAVAKLQWESASILKEVVPSSQLTPSVAILTPSPVAGAGLSAAFFPSESLTGVPWMRRDRVIDFNWGGGAPDPTMPADHFSVRWTGSVQTRFTEPYDLIITADDGIRAWVDGVQVINDWIPSSPKERRCTIAGGAGVMHALKIEYFERTGGAVAKMEWVSASEGRQIVPEKCLYPNDLDVIPAVASAVSPAFIEGLHRPGLTVSAGSNPIISLGESRFAVNVPLSVVDDATVRITAGATVVTGTIAWTPTILSGSKTIVVRPGDALLFTTATSGTWSISFGCGSFRSSSPIMAGDITPVVFPIPGYYTATLKDASGIEASRVNVDVPGIANVTESIPCAVNYQRIKDISFNDAAGKALVSWTAGDAWIVTSAEASLSDTPPMQQRLSIKPTENKAGRLIARINGYSGQILATWAVNPFIIRSDSERAITIENGFPDGSILCNASLLMEPLVAGIDIKMYAYVAGVTFDDSTTVRWITSGDFIAEGTRGAYPFKLIRSPGIKTGVCTWRIAYDHGVQISN